MLATWLLMDSVFVCATRSYRRKCVEEAAKYLPAGAGATDKVKVVAQGRHLCQLHVDLHAIHDLVQHELFGEPADSVAVCRRTRGQSANHVSKSWISKCCRDELKKNRDGAEHALRTT